MPQYANSRLSLVAVVFARRFVKFVPNITSVTNLVPYCLMPAMSLERTPPSVSMISENNARVITTSCPLAFVLWLFF